MLTPFDYAVIEYAQSRSEDSGKVYERIDKLDHKYRDQHTEDQLLALLDKVKGLDDAPCATQDQPIQIGLVSKFPT